MAILKSFCLHHTGAPERKLALEPRFKELGIEVEWVELFHPSTIDVSSLNITHDGLNLGEISLYLKHQYCYDQQQKHGYENILVFEDDIMLPDMDFWAYMDRVVKEFEEIQGDINFIGECCDIRPMGITADKYVYHHPSYRSRCTHCYLSSHRCLEAMMSELPDISNAMDWRFNEIIEKHKLKSCYTHPSLYQTTESGQADSLLREDRWKN